MSNGAPPAPASAWRSEIPLGRLIEGGLIGLVALACLVFQLRLPGRLISEPNYQEVGSVLLRERQPEDVVLLYPWWTERARLFVPDGLPVVGYQGSDADDLEAWSRVWLLAAPDLPRSNTSALMEAFGPGRREIGAERRFGNLSLRLFHNGRHRPRRFSLDRNLSSARVYLEGAAGERQPCQWDGQAHLCPKGARATFEWHEIGFQPRRCLRFNPPGGSSSLVVEVAAVPASEVTLLAGYTWDRGYFREGVSDAELILEVDGVSAVLPMPRGTVGLKRLSLPAAGESTVRVRSRAPNPEHRDLCLELYGLGVTR